MAKGAFKGGSYGGGMNMNMIRQAQKMQQDMLKMQEEIEKKPMRRLRAAEWLRLL
jgi:DNA-binding protein YbaB